MDKKGNQIVFFELLRAGLWEQSVRLSAYEPIDFNELYEMADGQSVVGLLAAGLEFVEDRKVVKKEALPFMKKVFSAFNRLILYHISPRIFYNRNASYYRKAYGKLCAEFFFKKIRAEQINGKHNIIQENSTI